MECQKARLSAENAAGETKSREDENREGMVQQEQKTEKEKVSCKLTPDMITPEKYALIMEALVKATKQEYKRALIVLHNKPGDARSILNLTNCQAFFLDNEFGLFTREEGRRIMNEVKKQAQKAIDRRERRKRLS